MALIPVQNRDPRTPLEKLRRTDLYRILALIGHPVKAGTDVKKMRMLIESQDLGPAVSRYLDDQGRPTGLHVREYRKLLKGAPTREEKRDPQDPLVMLESVNTMPDVRKLATRLGIEQKPTDKLDELKSKIRERIEHGDAA